MLLSVRKPIKNVDQVVNLSPTPTPHLGLLLQPKAKVQFERTVDFDALFSFCFDLESRSFFPDRLIDNFTFWLIDKMLPPDGQCGLPLLVFKEIPRPRVAGCLAKAPNLVLYRFLFALQDISLLASS
jgi:hypothetical protein